MRVKGMGLTGLRLGILLGLVMAFNSGAQTKTPKPPKPPKTMNVQGRVQMLDKSGSAITVVAGSVTRKVVYTADTQFMYGHSNNNKPGAADQVKEGNYVSCTGTIDKTNLMARECVYRESK